MGVESPHLRADAQRNRDRILAAARETFSENGLEASVAEVAARAGVGTATIFRRFPTKHDLVEEILELELDAVKMRAAEAAASERPAEALGAFMEWVVERFVGDRCMCEAADSDRFTRPRLQQLTSEVLASIELLVGRAQEEGAIRKDVVAEDIGFLLNAVGRAGLALERVAPGAWRRYVAILLDGLRPGGATMLPISPPTPQQLQRSKTSTA